MKDAVEMAVLSSVTHPSIVQVFSCLTDMVEVEGARASRGQGGLVFFCSAQSLTTLSWASSLCSSSQQMSHCTRMCGTALAALPDAKPPPQLPWPPCHHVCTAPDCAPSGSDCDGSMSSQCSTKTRFRRAAPGEDLGEASTCSLLVMEVRLGDGTGRACLRV
jgi:hypothetical protein